MAKYCDKSPCEALLPELGHRVFCVPNAEGTKYELIIPTPKGDLVAVYCPMCGTCWDSTEISIIQRWKLPLTRQRRRKVATG